MRSNSQKKRLTRHSALQCYVTAYVTRVTDIPSLWVGTSFPRAFGFDHGPRGRFIYGLVHILTGGVDILLDNSLAILRLLLVPRRQDSLRMCVSPADCQSSEVVLYHRRHMRSYPCMYSLRLVAMPALRALREEGWKVRRHHFVQSQLAPFAVVPHSLPGLQLR
jgi:hypothetical protein